MISISSNYYSRIIYHLLGGFCFWTLITEIYKFKNSPPPKIEESTNIGSFISFSYLLTICCISICLYIEDTIYLIFYFYKLLKIIIRWLQHLKNKIFVYENMNPNHRHYEDNQDNQNNNQQNDQLHNFNIDFDDLFSQFTLLPGQIKNYKNGDIYDGYMFGFKKHGSGYYYSKKNNITYLQKWHYSTLIDSKEYYQGNLIDKIHNLFVSNEDELGDELIDIRCIISHDIMKNPISLQCGHSFDKHCIVLSMLKDNYECPLCKQEIQNYEPNPYLIDKLKKCNFIYINDKNKSDDIDLETINKYYNNFFENM